MTLSKKAFETITHALALMQLDHKKALFACETLEDDLGINFHKEKLDSIKTAYFELYNTKKGES